MDFEILYGSLEVKLTMDIFFSFYGKKGVCKGFWVSLSTLTTIYCSLFTRKIIRFGRISFSECEVASIFLVLSFKRIIHIDFIFISQAIVCRYWVSTMINSSKRGKEGVDFFRTILRSKL